MARSFFTLPALLLQFIGVGLLSIFSISAHADVYGYVDADGTLHFSNTKSTPQHQLYMRGNDAIDASDIIVTKPKSRQSMPMVTPTPLPLITTISSRARYLKEHPNLKKYEDFLNQAATEFGLEPALLKAVMAAESGFNPMAVSPKGAIGLMQLMPATARRYGLSGDPQRSVSQKLTDPRTNIRLGAQYLRALTNMFPGKPELVIASYNAGEGAVQKYKNTIPPYLETRNYVKQVTQFYHLYLSGLPALVSTPEAANPWTDGRRRVQMTIPGPSRASAIVIGGSPETSQQSLE